MKTTNSFAKRTPTVGGRPVRFLGPEAEAPSRVSYCHEVGIWIKYRTSFWNARGRKSGSGRATPPLNPHSRTFRSFSFGPLSFPPFLSCQMTRSRKSSSGSAGCTSATNVLLLVGHRCCAQSNSQRNFFCFIWQGMPGARDIEITPRMCSKLQAVTCEGIGKHHRLKKNEKKNVLKRRETS